MNFMKGCHRHSGLIVKWQEKGTLIVAFHTLFDFPATSLLNLAILPVFESCIYKFGVGGYHDVLYIDSQQHTITQSSSAARRDFES